MVYEQTKAYCTSVKINLALTTSSSQLKFGNSIHDSQGSMEVKITIRDDAQISIDTDFVRADVLLLIFQ